MNRKSILLVFSLFITVFSYSQNLVWAKTMGGPTHDQGRAVQVNGSGEVITGGLFTGTVDFDPGPGTFTMTSAGYEDIYILKLNSNGDLVWAVSFGNATGTGLGTGEKLGNIALDASGNIYAVGTYSGTVDFNPGAGINNLTSAGLRDAYVLKLNTNGGYVWAKSLGGPSLEMGNGIDVDASGVYTTGYFGTGADFNPSATTNSLTAGGYDIFVSKLDLNGNYLWAQGMGGTGTDMGYAIKVNPVNNAVYTTGYFAGTADISPGTTGPPSLVSSGGNDIFISSLNATFGSYVGQAAMGGSGNDIALGIAFDATGNVYTTGSFTLSCDFDPGVAPNFLNSSGGTDAFVSKLTSSLTYLWAKQIDGPGSDEGEDLAIDALGNIYSTGFFSGTADFDPSLSTYTLSSTGQHAYAWKINSSGNLVWARNWGSSSSTVGSSIGLDAFANVYTTGSFNSTCNFDPAATNYTVASNGNLDNYVSKLSCTLPQTVTTNAPLALSLCIGTPTSMPVLMTSTPEANVTYSWTTIGATGISLSQTTGTASTVSFTASNSFSIVITGSNTCGTTSTTVSNITVNPLPVVSANASSTMVCSGSTVTLNGAGAASYTWSGGANNGVAFTPPSSQTYTVTGADVNSCANTATISLNVVSTPTITVTGKATVCLNSSNILSASGATSYSWSPGSVVSSTINAQPSSNTIYTVNSQDVNGCMGSATFSLNIVTPQTPDICEVTVDSISQYNNIVWDKTTYNNVDSFIVYREVSTGTYKRIGAQHQSVYSLFVDTARSVGPANGDPNITSYRYKLQIRDTCGNYSALSPYHNSIYFLTNSSGSFFWNTYIVEFQPLTPISTFDLIRDNNATGTWTVVGSCAGNQTSLNDPAYSSYPNAIYRVIGNGFSCNASAKTAQQINKSKSNVKNNFNVITGISKNEEGAFSIAPNPASSEIIVSFNKDINETTVVSVTSVLGESVIESEIHEGKKIVLPLTELPTGVYFIRVQQGKNFTTRKFIKN